MPKFSEWNPVLLTLITDADGSDLTVGTDAYTAKDVIGDLLSVAVPQRNGGIYIGRVMLVDAGDQTKSYYVHFFSAVPSTIADDAEFAPTVADKLIRFTTIKLDSAVNQDGTGSDVKGTKDFYTGEYEVSPNLESGKVYAYLEDIDASNPTTTTDFTLVFLAMVL